MGTTAPLKRPYQLYLHTSTVNSVKIFSHHLGTKPSRLIEAAIKEYLERRL